MAATGYLDSLIGGLADDVKKALKQAFTYILTNVQVGPIDHQKRAGNLFGHWVNSTTATSTSEFSVLHGIGSAPQAAIIGLDVGSSGSKTPILTVTRPADAMRIYLKADSGSTNAPFSIYLE